MTLPDLSAPAARRALDRVHPASLDAGGDPVDVYARAVWSVLVEPGDGVGAVAWGSALPRPTSPGTLRSAGRSRCRAPPRCRRANTSIATMPSNVIARIAGDGTVGYV